jgi:anti-sigma B factor antagonist
MMQDFSLASQPRDSAMIIKVSGDLDIVTCAQLDEELKRVRRTFDQIVIDMSAVEFMDTRSLAIIVMHWKAVTEAGGSLSLAGARYQYTKTLWITGLASRIPMFDTVDLAIASA